MAMDAAEIERLIRVMRVLITHGFALATTLMVLNFGYRLRLLLWELLRLLSPL